MKGQDITTFLTSGDVKSVWAAQGGRGASGLGGHLEGGQIRALLSTKSPFQGRGKLERVSRAQDVGGIAPSTLRIPSILIFITP